MKYPCWVAFVLGMLGACTPASPPASPDADANAPRCESRPDIAATAKEAKPIDCSNDAARSTASIACDKGDAAGCYGIGLCFKKKVRTPGEITNPTEREGTIITAMIGLGAACDRGIADACMEHVDLFEHQKTEAWEREKACEFTLRACNLGHKTACSACTACNQPARP